MNCLNQEISYLRFVHCSSMKYIDYELSYLQIQSMYIYYISMNYPIYKYNFFFKCFKLKNNYSLLTINHTVIKDELVFKVKISLSFQDKKN